MVSHAQCQSMGGRAGTFISRVFFTTRFLNLTCQFAPFDVIRLPPALNLHYSVELFCEAYVHLREANRDRPDWGSAAAKRRRTAVAQLGSGSTTGQNPPLIRISNRNSPGLEFSLNHSKQRTSYFLIATKTRIWNSGCQRFASENRPCPRPVASPISIFPFQFSALQTT